MSVCSIWQQAPLAPIVPCFAKYQTQHSCYSLISHITDKIILIERFWNADDGSNYVTSLNFIFIIIIGFLLLLINKRNIKVRRVSFSEDDTSCLEEDEDKDDLEDPFNLQDNPIIKVTTECDISKYKSWSCVTFSWYFPDKGLGIFHLYFFSFYLVLICLYSINVSMYLCTVSASPLQIS